MAGFDKKDFEELFGMGEEKDSLSVKDIISFVKEYVAYLWQKKWIVVAVAFFMGVMGVLYAFLRPVKYTASYVFTIEGGGGSGSGGFGSLASMLGLGGNSMGAFSGDNLVELLKSKSLVEKVLLKPVEVDGQAMTYVEYKILSDSLRSKCDEFEVDEDDERTTVSLCEVSFPVGLSRDSFTRVQDSVLSMFSSSILKDEISVARRDKKLAFVDFSYTSKDEAFALSFSEALLSEVSEYYVETKTALSKANIKSFQHRADSVRRELDKTLSIHASYADANINPARRVVNVQLQKMQTDIQILGTVYSEMIKNIEMLNLDLARETPLIQIIDKPYCPLSHDKIAKKKALVIGGFIGGFLTCLVLCAIKYFKDLIEKEEEKEKEKGLVKAEENDDDARS